MNDPETYTQRDVIDWFDRTYAEHGFDYLRPVAAYPIYLQLLGAVPGERLLDVACGPGQLLRAAIARGVDATGVDVSAQAVAMARDALPDARVEEGNAEALPFDDASFSLVTCIGAIERMFDRPAALAEMRRVATPDARFCVMVRNANTLSWRIWRQWLDRQNRRGHQDALSLDAWTALFGDAGFAIDDVLPDQWFRQRVRRVLRGFRAPDVRRPEPVARGWLPLGVANEFIFVMRHAP